MESLQLNNNLLFVAYGSCLQILASIFLLQDVLILARLENGLPIEFLVRCAIFWFISMMLAVIIFMIYLRVRRLYLSQADKIYIKRISKTIALCGIISISVAASLVYLSL